MMIACAAGIAFFLKILNRVSSPKSLLFAETFESYGCKMMNFGPPKPIFPGGLGEKGETDAQRLD